MDSLILCSWLRVLTGLFRIILDTVLALDIRVDPVTGLALDTRVDPVTGLALDTRVDTVTGLAPDEEHSNDT